MSSSQINVFLPDRLFNELTNFIVEENLKLSHVVTEAISNQLHKMRNERYITRLNNAFESSEIIQEQHEMAELMTSSVEELEW